MRKRGIANDYFSPREIGQLTPGRKYGSSSLWQARDSLASKRQIENKGNSHFLDNDIPPFRYRIVA